MDQHIGCEASTILLQQQQLHQLCLHRSVVEALKIEVLDLLRKFGQWILGTSTIWLLHTLQQLFEASSLNQSLQHSISLITSSAKWH